MTLSDALTSYFEITKLTKPLLESAAQIFDNEELMDRLSDNAWVKEYVYGRDLLDLLDDFPTESLQPDQLHQVLRKFRHAVILFPAVTKRTQMKCISQYVQYVMKHMTATALVCAVFN